MTNANNFFRQTITDLDANSNKAITNLNDTFRMNNNGQPCNFLHVVNKANKPITIQLNGDVDESFEIGATGGTFIISKEDMINYHSLQVVEEDGHIVTGKIKVTGGVL